MKTILKINGIDLSEVIIDTKWSGSMSRGMGVNSMDLIVQRNAEALKYIDLRGEVRVEIIEGEEHIKAFKGLVKIAHPDGLHYHFHCQDESQLLSEAMQRGGFGSGMLPPEIVFYIASENSLSDLDPKNFYVSDNQSLFDTGLVTRERKFIYIAPVPWCRLNPQINRLKVADCWIYKATESSSVDDRTIDNFKSDDNIWQESETRAMFYVKSKDFLGALRRGQEKLQRLLDIFSFSANYASTTYGSEEDENFFEYDRSRIFSNVQEAEWSFVRDLLPSNRFWMHWNSSRRLESPLLIREEDPISHLYGLFQELNEDDINENEQVILDSLHALRQVRQSLNPKDALDHIWRSIEFLVGRYEREPLFSKIERKNLISTAKKKLDEDSVNPHLEEQKRRLENVLNGKLNELSLRAKWDLFCDAHSLSFPEVDEEFLWRTLRDKRNGYQHGRKAELTVQDTERGATIVEKALMAAVVQSRKAGLS